MAVAELRLEIRDYTGPGKWRWALTDVNGMLIKDHKVCLDEAAWQFEAFMDVHRYLSWHIAPDRRGIDDVGIVAELGEWVTEQVLGSIAGELAEQALRRHLTVTVIAPFEATDLLLCPLQLANVGGKPLAAQDVTLVMQSGKPDNHDAPANRDRLRILGLFSLPEGGQPLNLHRERQALVTLIGDIAAAGKAAEVHVLQYGVTRKLLGDVLAEADGWDIIHISGHGAPGELLLETADGGPDWVSAADLADLLVMAREHVRLVTVAACWSAAQTVAVQRRRLGLPAMSLTAQSLHSERTHSPLQPPPSSSPLAIELANRLNCAVLAMRYPVDDDFTIALSGLLYRMLAEKGQPLTQALALALRQLSAEGGLPALAVATPAIFGGSGVGLSLAAPDRSGPADYSATGLKLAGFLPQPDRFVGRVGVMARSSAALALRSGVAGVLLHGMPGGGKSACALELAYGHEHAFDQLVWYKAPDDGMAIEGALTDFALTLEQCLPGFQMAHVLVSAEALTSFLPKLAELVKQHRLLIVVDNAESLISEGGEWKDGCWSQVIGALTGHTGLGRLIVTSRRVPDGLTGLRVESVGTLSPDEALLLLRELPNLKALSLGRIPGIKPQVARRLACRALEAAQGHPKLLELADGQAAYPDRLAALLETGEQEWRTQGKLPGGFFATGETAASTGDYWHVLAVWTSAVADTLAPGERDLFWFLCCLEEPDRERWVLGNNWANLWQRLGRDGDPPDIDKALAAVTANGLAAIGPPGNNAHASYALHPGVAEAGRNRAGTPFRDVVDTQAGKFWTAEYLQASGADGVTIETRLAVRAALAAVPYLLRQQQWQDASALLDRAFAQDPSRASAAAIVPAVLQVISLAPSLTEALPLLMRALDPATAETLMRDRLGAAVAAGDWWAASVTAGRLLHLYLLSGRLPVAGVLAEQRIAYTRQASASPWAQLGAEVQRLQVLSETGQAEYVLSEAIRLREHMATLSSTADPRGTVFPWITREELLSVGRHAALRLQRWEDALHFGAERTASMQDRNAPAGEIAWSRFNDYGPLLGLGRTDDALALLQDCLHAFRDDHNAIGIGKTFSALAEIEDDRGHGDAALRFERDALRHKYLVGDIIAIAVSYNNLGNYLALHAQQPTPALASHLAAALIRTLLGISGNNPGSAQSAIRGAATDLRMYSTIVPPANVADMCHQLDDIPGTDLPGLIQQLCPDNEMADQTLRKLIVRAFALMLGPFLPV